MAYDPNNIFAKILRGEIPCEKLYEDDETFVFMDIMPRADGHCLVIPKTPCRNMLDASDAQLAACLRTVRKMGHAVMKGLGAEGVTVQQFNEAVGGQEVFHLHYHILPRHDGVRLRPPGKMEDQAVIKEIAAKIRAGLDG
ncbi:HIT family protein [Thalassobius vesicularis]|uniref:HIT family protein n=1 Tax=Thalassobius vesicularis TaxID=1294297 RepID=A0A4S3M8D5_9RHOB|nr:HIT family protein [Thalassobius vesicularis]THD73529.1 HIT family protein [Thalassobius vesicularis]